MVKLQGGPTLQRVDLNASWTGASKYQIISEMVNTSPVIMGLLNAIKDPIRTAIWTVKDNGADSKITDYLKDNFFSFINFYELIDSILHYLEYGYMPFEKEWIVNNGKYYLKPHPRMPFSIVSWQYDYKKGKVLSAIQTTTNGTATIKYENLLIFTNNRLTLSPEGQSILRPLYKGFVLGGEVETATADGLKKNSMGVPIAHVPDTINDTDEKDLKNFLSTVNSSPYANFIEKGEVNVRFQGVEGAIPDSAPFLNNLKSSMNDSQLANILNLSTSNRGSRAVGGTLAPPFYNRIAAIAKYITSKLNEEIKEMVDNNFKTDIYPTIVAGGISAKDIIEKAYALAAVQKYLPNVDLREYLLNGFEIPYNEKVKK